MSKLNEKLLKLLARPEGLTYRKGIKIAGWTAGNGRFTRIAEGAGYRLISKRLPDRDVLMRAVPRGRGKRAA